MSRVSDAELEEWAAHRADDAGRLAQELIKLRPKGGIFMPSEMSSEHLAAAQKAWNQMDYGTASAVMFDNIYKAFISASKATK